MLNITSGDEVIMPSFTFVSTANAFALRGAKIVFVDINPQTMNLDEELLEAALTPKTREVTDPLTGQTTTVDIDKSEVVRPEIPDYYAKRRAEYPTLGDQMDEQWKGGDAAEAMHQKILAVKAKYPKPSWL